MFFWFIASIVGLWFVVRHSQIPGEFFSYYVVFTALNFLAFEGGWVFGGMFHKWWASYIYVFTVAAFVSIAFWWVWWHENIILPAFLPSGQQSQESDVLKSDAGTISNLALILFVVLIIPACYGAYCRRRRV